MRIHDALLLTTGTCLLAAAALAQGHPTTRPTSRKAWTGALSEKEFAALHELKKGKPPKLHGKMIDVGDAKAYLSLPKAGRTGGAVLLIHEWWGLNDNIKHWADRIAADGHAALAIDLYGGTVATTRDGALEAMRAVDGEAARKTLLRAHEFLKEDPRVRAKKRASIGWCFGGGWSLQLALAAPDLDAAVIYYGRLVNDPEKLAKIEAPILGVFGNEDKGIPPSAVDAFEEGLKKAKRKARILRYDANHAFANPSSARYDQKHAAAAWREVRAFLGERLSAPQRAKFALGAKTVEYVIPPGWRKAGPRMMRNVNLTPADGVECYVTVLPGPAGGVGPNVNRWRQQMGQKPLSDDEIAKLGQIEMLGGKAVLIGVDGSFRGMRGQYIKEARMVATIRSLAEMTVFVKMIGPRRAVTRNEAPFKEFCRSMK